MRSVTKLVPRWFLSPAGCPRAGKNRPGGAAPRLNSNPSGARKNRARTEADGRLGNGSLAEVGARGDAKMERGRVIRPARSGYADRGPALVLPEPQVRDRLAGGLREPQLYAQVRGSRRIGDCLATLAAVRFEQ